MKTKLIILFFAMSMTSIAQSGNETKTLFGKGKPRLGYFLSPSVQSGRFAGSTTVIPGLGAGVVFNNRFSVSLFYKMTITENSPKGEMDQLYLHGQWVGFKGDYSFNPEKVVHLSIPLEISIGEIELDKKESFENYPLIVPSADVWFLNVEPGIALEINLLKYLKLQLAAGYRLVSNFSFRDLTENELTGITFSAGVKIGLFQIN